MPAPLSARTWLLDSRHWSLQGTPGCARAGEAWICYSHGHVSRWPWFVLAALLFRGEVDCGMKSEQQVLPGVQTEEGSSTHRNAHLFKIACTPSALLTALVRPGCGLRLSGNSENGFWGCKIISELSQFTQAGRIMCLSVGFRKFTQTDFPSFCVPAYPASLQGSRSLTRTRLWLVTSLVLFQLPMKKLGEKYSHCHAW